MIDPNSDQAIGPMGGIATTQSWIQLPGDSSHKRGRKSIYGEPMTETVNFDCTGRQSFNLRFEAEVKGVSVAALIRSRLFDKRKWWQRWVK